MFQKFKVLNHLGDSIELLLGEPEKSGFLIKSISGIGGGNAAVNTTESATLDGSMFNSSKILERYVTIELLFIETLDGESIETVRQKVYKFFPLKRKIKFIAETDNRALYLNAYVEGNDVEIFSEQSGCTITLRCPDPYFYALTETEHIFYGVDPAFEFPFSNESLTEPLLIMGYIKNKDYNDIYYTGDMEIGVVIDIFALGTVENLNIYNLSNRQVVRVNTEKLTTMTGSPIIAGDHIVITSIRGEKTITLLRSGVTYNILNCLEKNSQWLTLSKGDNVFAFSADSGSTSLQFKVISRPAYEGV